MVVTVVSVSGGKNLFLRVALTVATAAVVAT